MGIGFELIVALMGKADRPDAEYLGCTPKLTLREALVFLMLSEHSESNYFRWEGARVWVVLYIKQVFA